MNRETKTPKRLKEEFETLVGAYLASNPYLPKQDKKVSELEIRFGTNKSAARSLSKIDYDNVAKQLYACGFSPEGDEEGLKILRVIPEFRDATTGRKRISNIRAEIVGVDQIQQYCKTNSIQTLIDSPSALFNKIKFTQKTSVKDERGNIIQKLDMDDYGFRVAYQLERDYTVTEPLSLDIIRKWPDSKKIFRYMNRVRFRHPDYPVFADLSIIKTSETSNRYMIPHNTIQEAKVFTNPESYEIELEIDNKRVGAGSSFPTLKSLMESIRTCIRIVLAGLQESKFPIPYSERDLVLSSYLLLLKGEEEEEGESESESKVEKSNTGEERRKRVLPSAFIGPGSFTLQIDNMVAFDEDSRVPNIRKNYCVTDKADGDRKLLYISSQGKIYLIDTNMKVTFTGSVTPSKSLYDSLLDGEHVKYDKDGKYINLYIAFDVYYIKKRSIREYEFMKSDDEEKDEEEEKEGEEKEEKVYRQDLLSVLINQHIRPTSIISSSKKEEENRSGFRIQCKTFYKGSEKQSIFQGCSTILGQVRDNVFEYNTDGLIFTPINLPVGGSNEKKGKAGPLYKSTWDQSFKWKPPQYNTIDFLVSFKRDPKTGKPEIHHEFQDGTNTSIKQYRVLVLRCGFDSRKHGFLNPFQDLLNGNIPSPTDIDNSNAYRPVPFLPTNPSDDTACFANVWLTDDGKHIMTEEGESFDENMIVEFQYDKDSPKQAGWRWTPLRVRYDKTSELLAGGKNYGNAYHVANNNWQSIHDPITEEMISTGQMLERQQTDITDKYYNRGSTESNTKSLRDFHNRYVKRSLINAASSSSRNGTLIDYAVGKAGDMSKWIEAKLGFVFGLDISKDNIHNQIDGACARYLDKRKETSAIPDALFVVGNSSHNIRDGTAFSTEKDKQVMNAVFGLGSKDKNQLGKGVYDQFGKGESGFNISSCQFALHYFFENKTTLHSFLRNISECTKTDGYFIATCYDGKEVFKLLNEKKRDESVAIFKNESRIYEITKLYDETGFPDDEESIGYPINVYQESINLTFKEYLVNFTYLTQLMENYGFLLVTKDEAARMNLPSGSGLFSELFARMESDVKRDRRLNFDFGTALNMSPEEKRISFMNRYCIFKKLRSVDAETISKAAIATTASADAGHATALLDKKGSPVSPGSGIKRKKKLVAFTPVNDNPVLTKKKLVIEPAVKVNQALKDALRLAEEEEEEEED